MLLCIGLGGRKPAAAAASADVMFPGLPTHPPDSTMSHHPPIFQPAQVLVAKSGAAAALVELCKSPNEELREAAAVALWDLAYDSSLGREAIARAGAVPWLAQLLLFGGVGAKEAAAACLAELAAVGLGVQQQIRDAGAVQLLEGLQKSGE